MMYAVYRTGSFPALIARVQGGPLVGPAEACLPVPAGVDDDTHCVISATEIGARPAIALTATQSLGAGEPWDIPDAPAGTRVIVDGDDLGEADIGGVSLSFPLPAVYRVELRPPIPWRGGICDVTVTA